MMSSQRLLLSFLLLIGWSVSPAGCGHSGPAADPLSPRSDAAVRMTAQPVAALPGQPVASLPGGRVSALLDFDSPDALTFVTSEPANAIRADLRVARSGR